MKVVSAQQMRDIERRSAELGLPSAALMDNAGLAFAREVRRWRGSIVSSPVLVLVGPGNNGGDGLVAARHLHDWGARVHLYLYGQRTDADPNYRLAREREIAMTEAGEDGGFTLLRRLLASAEVVIDALLGTGRLRPIEGVLKGVLSEVGVAKERRPSLAIVALDLPTGLDADSGAADPACLAADLTVTLGYPKLGLFAFPGAARVGRLVVADIGIPPRLGEGVPVEMITPHWAKAALPQRPLDAHKGTFGRVLAVVGSINYIGAAYLACAGAARVGAGLVTLATARSLLPILAAKLTEVTYIPLPEAEEGVIAAEAAPVVKEELGGSVLLLGCGLGQHPSTVEFVQRLLSDASPMASVIDADGLNILARMPEWWRNWEGEAVLTPHPGEMARLTGLPMEEIQSKRLEVAQQAAARWGKVVVLKGAHTVVTSPRGRAGISPVANPGLASAGTGDVLAGAIAGLLAQGLSPFDAAAGGVYLHAAAGGVVRERLGDAGMLASDLLQTLPLVIKGLKTP